MKYPSLVHCPLCHSTNVQAYQVGWSTIHCKSCYLQLSRPIPLKELITIWNNRIDTVITQTGPTTVAAQSIEGVPV